MIRHHSFRHGWFYHYRVHLRKLDERAAPFPALQRYLHGLFSGCPDEYFARGPRSSGVRVPFALAPVAVPGHAVCALARHGQEHGRLRTAHSNVQLAMLEQDRSTVAVEVPLWLLPEELPVYEELFGCADPLTGHIDALSIEDGNVWVWDYKPNARAERYAHIQTYLYAVMLATRTGIPLDRFRCGYFDERDCYVFIPPSPEEAVPIPAR